MVDLCVLKVDDVNWLLVQHISFYWAVRKVCLVFFPFFLLLVQHISFYWAVRKVCLVFFPFFLLAVGATHLFLLGRPQGVLSVCLLY